MAERQGGNDPWKPIQIPSRQSDFTTSEFEFSVIAAVVVNMDDTMIFYKVTIFTAGTSLSHKCAYIFDQSTLLSNREILLLTWVMWILYI